MKNLGAILAIGITSIIIIAIGSINFFLAAEAQSSEDAEVLPIAVEESIIAQDTEAVRAAYKARETLLLSQIADLDAELIERQKAYDLHLEELNGLTGTAEKQLSELENQENVLLEQIDQLLVAQNERSSTYESKRQEAYYQYQVNIQQLQAQLDEGNAKLNEALARLGQ
jgi:DNA repair exonuclease SbcCD ATPase subunit